MQVLLHLEDTADHKDARSNFFESAVVVVRIVSLAVVLEALGYLLVFEPGLVVVLLIV